MWMNEHGHRCVSIGQLYDHHSQFLIQNEEPTNALNWFQSPPKKLKRIKKQNTKIIHNVRIKFGVEILLRVCTPTQYRTWYVKRNDNNNSSNNDDSGRGGSSIGSGNSGIKSTKRDIYTNVWFTICFRYLHDLTVCLIGCVRRGSCKTLRWPLNEGNEFYWSEWEKQNQNARHTRIERVCFRSF